MDVDAMLVSRMVNTSSVDRVVAAGVEPRHFADQEMRAVYEMCLMHYRIYGSSPSVDVVRDRFPNLRLRPVIDDLSFLIDEFKQVAGWRAAVTKWRDIGMDIDRAEAGDREVLRRMPDIFMEHARQMALLVPSSEVSRLTDMDKRVEAARAQQEEGVVTGVRTPHRGLDPYVPAFKPTQFVVFCAVSGVGKSTGLVREGIQAFEDGKRVTMVSLEMDEDEIWEMYDSRFAQVSRKAIERRSLSADDYGRWEQAAARLRQAPNEVHLFTPGDVTIDHLAQYVEQTSPDVLLVDYISLMKPILRHDSNDWGAVAEISADLKRLARTYKIVVCAAAQSSKSATEIGPTEDNIAFAKNIINDANVVIGYHQDPVMGRVNKVQVRLIKNRRGDKGPRGDSGYFECYEMWDRDKMIFQEWSDAVHNWGARAGMGAV
jgi:replicative DNA helicase